MTNDVEKLTYEITEVLNNATNYDLKTADVIGVLSGCLAAIIAHNEDQKSALKIVQDVIATMTIAYMTQMPLSDPDGGR